MKAERADILIWCGCGLLVIAAAAISLRPLPAEKPALVPVQQNEPVVESTSDLEKSTLDRGVFSVDLWVEPPAPSPPTEPVAQQASAPEPPPDLDLIAITRSGESYTAILYNKRADRLLTVAAGDTVGAFVVLHVGAVEIRFESRGRETVMRLDQPRIAASAGETSDG